jgi:hypothetical protein
MFILAFTFLQAQHFQTFALNKKIRVHLKLVTIIQSCHLSLQALKYKAAIKKMTTPANFKCTQK